MAQYTRIISNKVHLIRWHRHEFLDYEITFDFIYKLYQVNMIINFGGNKQCLILCSWIKLNPHKFLKIQESNKICSYHEFQNSCPICLSLDETLLILVKSLHVQITHTFVYLHLHSTKNFIQIFNIYE